MEAAALSDDNATTNVGNATISVSATSNKNTSNTTATSKDDDVQLVVATPNEDAASPDNEVVEVSSKEPARKKKKVTAVITEIVWSELEAELLEGEKQHRAKVIAGDAQPREEDNPFDFTLLGLPKQLKVSKHYGTSPTWDFYLCLDLKVVDYIVPKTNKGGGGGGIRKHFNTEMVRKPFTHICTLCLEDLKKTSPTVVSFKRALRNIQNVGNGENHLTTIHRENAKVVRYIEEKQNKKSSKGALDSGAEKKNEEGTKTTSSPASRNAVVQALRKGKDDITRELTATWLINNHLGHHTTQSLEFKAMMTHLDPEFQPIGRSTFLKILNGQFTRMVGCIKKLLSDGATDFAGVQWLSVGHDIWNTVIMDGALGSCVRLMTADMEVYNIASVLKKHNISHGANDVGEVLEEVYHTRYGISLLKEAGYVASDTTGCARNVSATLGAVQDDCEMHVVNLAISYTFGINENTRTITTVGLDGTKTKHQTVVTPGGRFDQGMKIVRSARGFVNFFKSSPQRKQKLDDAIKFLDLPTIALINFPDTRVAFASKLFQTVLANYYAFTKVEHNDFPKIKSRMSEGDWETMQEMEAICSALCGYAVNEAQTSAGMISSLRPYFRRALEHVANREKFKVMSLDRHSSDKLLHTIPRKKKRVVDFTEGGRKCLLRLKEQIKKRLPPPTPMQSLATLLDPVTKKFAQALLGPSVYPQTLELLKKEHSSLFIIWSKREHTNQPVDKDITATAASANETEGVLDELDSSSDEEDLVIEAVAVIEKDVDEDELLLQESDRIVDKWMENDQVSNDFLYKGAKKMPDKVGVMVQIEEVIASFDTMRYFRERGGTEFPTVALLARIHFSRLDNAGFQERVFSTAKQAQGKDQANMAFDQLEQRTLLAHNKEFVREMIKRGAM